MNKEFGAKLRYYRNEKGYDIYDLSAIVGISDRYLYNLEAGKKKNISFQKLRDLILTLSLDGVVRPGLEPIQYGTTSNFPDQLELNLHVLKDLLFAATGLYSYTHCYRQIITSAGLHAIKEEVIYDRPVRKDAQYEIWLFGNYTVQRNIESMIYDIVNYKLHYRIFISLKSNLEELHRDLTRLVHETISNAAAETREFLGKNKWEKLLTVYLLPDVYFLSNFHLYNAKGQGLFGLIEMHANPIQEQQLELMETFTVNDYQEKIKGIMFKVAENSADGGKRFQFK
jgi:transcriptional regulator with XRE-family HTH domain